MFVQQPKLLYLDMPARRLRRLYVSTVDIQIALPGYPSQMAAAYLAALTSGKGLQVVLGLYLVESRCPVFYLPQAGEVAPEKAEQVFQDGVEFAESMGFVLADADIRDLSPETLDHYWRGLPICTHPAPKPAQSPPRPPARSTGQRETAVEQVTPVPVPVVQEKGPEPVISLEERRKRCRESLGRFLASL